MKISIKVKTQANKEEVQKIDEVNYLVKVKELPIENKANKAVIKALSNFFDLPKSNIILVSGEKSKNKIFEIIK